MYLRAAHAEFDIPTLRRFIHDNPLGLFITALPSSNFPTIQATHIPWLLDVHDEASDSELGTLRGHLARPNPHSKALIEAAQSSTQTLTEEASIIFTGHAHHYVTPQFYVETKPSTGKVVPSWDYSAVQAYGTAKIYFDSSDPETGAFLQKAVNDLSRYAETKVMGYQEPWSVDDAPERYIQLLKKNIIGVEVQITRLEGKWKMSQELREGDREGVVDGFRKLGSEEGEVMARTVEERGRELRGKPF